MEEEAEEESNNFSSLKSERIGRDREQRIY